MLEKRRRAVQFSKAGLEMEFCTERGCLKIKKITSDCRRNY